MPPPPKAPAPPVIRVVELVAQDQVLKRKVGGHDSNQSGREAASRGSPAPAREHIRAGRRGVDDPRSTFAALQLYAPCLSECGSSWTDITRSHRSAVSICPLRPRDGCGVVCANRDHRSRRTRSRAGAATNGRVRALSGCHGAAACGWVRCLLLAAARRHTAAERLTNRFASL